MPDGGRGQAVLCPPLTIPRRSCHNPDQPRLTPDPLRVPRPTEPFLAEAWDRTEWIFTRRKQRRWWRKQFGSFLSRPKEDDPEYEYRRSQRLECLVLLLRVLIARHDGRTMRVCRDAPGPDDEVDGIPMSYLMEVCELSSDQVERTIGDLKNARFELWTYSNDRRRRLPHHQPKEWVKGHQDRDGRWIAGHWKTYPAIRCLEPILFRSLDLVVAHGRWQKKKKDDWVAAQSDIVTEPTSQTTAKLTIFPMVSLPPEELAALETELLLQLRRGHPDWTDEQVRLEVVRLLE
jgi:hypothetical protein